MRIAIITLLGHFNYGNRLQNYALQKFISNYVETVETIWFEKNYLPEIKRDKLDKKYVKNIFKFIFNWKGARKIEKYYGRECIRQYNIKKFSDKYINIRYDYKINKKIDNIYDYFIVGSDQVWNPQITHKYALNYFFDFLDSDTKRGSYAASFGDIKWNYPEYTIRIQSLLNKFSFISSREETGVDICTNIFNADCAKVVDPTLLLPSYIELLKGKKKKTGRVKPAG